MPKPTRYYVDYEDPDLIERELRRHNGDRDLVDPADVMSWEDFKTLKAARAFQAEQNREGRYACIKERRNLVDETPFWDISAGVPPWTLWDSADEIIEDSK
jgi:hypothetical protein